MSWLAAQAGLPRPNLWRMLKGDKSLSLSTIEAVTAALELPDDHFIEIRIRRLSDWLTADPDELDRTYRRVSRGRDRGA